MKKKLWVIVPLLCLLIPAVLLAVGMAVTVCPRLVCGDTPLQPGLTYYVLRYRDGSVSDVGDEYLHRHPENFEEDKNPLGMLWQMDDSAGKKPDEMQIILHTKAGEDVVCRSYAELSAYPSDKVEYAFLYMVWKMHFSTNANAVYYFK